MKTSIVKNLKVIPLLLLLAIAACQSKSGDNQNNATTPTYQEAIAMIFADSSNVTEWHDSPISQEAVSEVALSEGDATGSCGTKIMLTNNGSRAAKVTISTVYPFDDSPWETSTHYIVQPGTTIHAANNKICYKGKETPFTFKIEGATYNLDD